MKRRSGGGGWGGGGFHSVAPGLSNGVKTTRHEIGITGTIQYYMSNVVDMAVSGASVAAREQQNTGWILFFEVRSHYFRLNTPPPFPPPPVSFPYPYHRRRELDVMEDPKEAYRRRGAHWTFDGRRFLREVGEARKSGRGSFPGFDHAVGDPIENALQVYTKRKGYE